MRMGDKLKQIRLSLGLDQTQMSKGIMDRSFYSRIESNDNKIRLHYLLALLAKNHVPLLEFLDGFGNVEPKNRWYQEQIEIAFFTNDVDTLKQIREDKQFTNLRVKQVIELLLTELNDHSFPYSNKTARKLKYHIFKTGKWDQDSLWILSMSMILYNFHDLVGIIDSIFNKYNKSNYQDEYSLRLLANIAVRFAAICYYNKQENEFKLATDFLNKLPASSKLLMQKLMGRYFEAKFSNDQEQQYAIKTILDLTGYEKYLSSLMLE